MKYDTSQIGIELRESGVYVRRAVECLVRGTKARSCEGTGRDVTQKRFCGLDDLKDGKRCLVGSWSHIIRRKR
jgi:hypothetical protein